MYPPRPANGTRIVILSGAGLSAASGVPVQRGAQAMWRGHRIDQITTPEAWFADRELVRTYYDECRLAGASVLPNAAHDALSRLQLMWGSDRITLVTHTVDGLLRKAGAPEIIATHGSLWALRCEDDVSHPHVGCFGKQNRDRRCAICQALLRPAVVWSGEEPRFMDRVHEALDGCDVFLAIGAQHDVPKLLQRARDAGASTMEINVRPSGHPFDTIIEEVAEVAVPGFVHDWLDETE